MLTDGATGSNLSGPNCLIDISASFSQAISTSPMPRSKKVVVDPRTRVKHWHVGVQLRDELPCLGLIAVALAQRIAPRAKKVPSRPARRLGIWRDH